MTTKSLQAHRAIAARLSALVGQSLHRVVLDANLLAKIWITDLLLKIAENTALFEPVWTELILEETYKAQTLKFKRPWSKSASHYFISELKRSFPTSTISGYETWIDQCTNDEGDRHILACAIEANAAVILTYNGKHFAPEHLDHWEVLAMHPQDYLLLLLSKKPKAIVDQINTMAEEKKILPSEVLRHLNQQAPKFTERLLKELA